MYNFIYIIMYTLQYFIFVLPISVLFLGICGLILWQKNLVLLIISLELMFIASNIGFILTSLYFDDILGYIFSVFSLTIAGAEVSLGLAITILMFRRLDSVFITKLKYLKS